MSRVGSSVFMPFMPAVPTVMLPFIIDMIVSSKQWLRFQARELRKWTAESRLSFLSGFRTARFEIVLVTDSSEIR